MAPFLTIIFSLKKLPQRNASERNIFTGTRQVLLFALHNRIIIWNQYLKKEFYLKPANQKVYFKPSIQDP